MMICWHFLPNLGIYPLIAVYATNWSRGAAAGLSLPSTLSIAQGGGGMGVRTFFAAFPQSCNSPDFPAIFSQLRLLLIVRFLISQPNSGGDVGRLSSQRGTVCTRQHKLYDHIRRFRLMLQFHGY